MKTIQIILLVIIIIGIGLIFTQKYWVSPLVDFILRQETESVASRCLPEQRNVDACIEIYQPVCATVQIQCIKAPCDPIQQTFPNACNACKNSLVKSYVAGECQESKASN